MNQQQNSTIHAAGKVVGKIEGNVFIKSIKASKHQLRSPKAWALDTQSLNDAEKAGAKAVSLQDKETGMTYTASIALIRVKGIEIDRGFGEQVALPLHLWHVEQPGTRQLELALC